jgi:signal transduction histidine kinase/CheY-like chemotaxis protein
MKSERADWRLPTYLTLVVLAGCALAASAVLGEGLSYSSELLVLSLLAAVVAPHTVRIGTRMDMSAFHPFVLTSILLLGITPSLVVATAGVFSLGLCRRARWPAYQLAFNTGVFLVTTWLTAQTYLLAGGTLGWLPADRAIPAMGAATLVFFLCNTLLIAGVVGITSGVPAGKVWREKYLWSAASYFAGGALALVMGNLVLRFGIYSLVLSLPVAILIYSSYRLYVEKMEEKRRHLEDIERMNQELERKVRERTRELEIVNQMLKESNAELVRANRLKSEFLANMSHELRTPLNAIIGFSELLLDPGTGALKQDQKEYVSDILSSGRHLLELINDILDLSKIEAGKMKLSPDEFELAGAVEEALMTLRVEASRKQIGMEARLDPEVPLLVADRGKFKQIVTNLLSNAVKFTPAGGRVTLTTERDGDGVRVSVEDTGIGIRPEDQERIFAAFVQVDGSYARKYQGTGLGLTLVKRFVEMHRGEITVFSEVGKGSVFTFRLPRSLPGGGSDAAVPVPGAGRPAPGEHPPAEGPGHLILVVEDNPANLKLARDVLRSRGYRVLEATSGEEALDTVKFIRPDLILMDIQLPGMDGLTATRRLKGDPATRDIPTVALTAHAMKRDEERVREAGCVGYIAKPIDTASFPLRIAEYLRPGDGPDPAPGREVA